MEKTMCELFAGVGGFRAGMERLGSGWETVWFSQWEPGKKKQWAHACYVQHYGECMELDGKCSTGADISTVDKAQIPDHSLLVGGFPCQDYSVAHSLGTSKGIEGKKGVLWWQIVEVLEKKRPPFCLFENVDRLLKSPSEQPGRDFSIMLACLAANGYSAEWRVVNAASYGAAQRRRRTYIFAYRDGTAYGRRMSGVGAGDILWKDGFMQGAFPAKAIGEISSFRLDEDIVEVSRSATFAYGPAGHMSKGEASTAAVEEEGEGPLALGSILEEDAGGAHDIPGDKLDKWKYLKGAKKVARKSASGHEYVFSEGAIAFPDPAGKPARTMLTSESTLNRSTHVVEDPATGALRTLTPTEAERLQGFDDGWTLRTAIGDMPERMRFFCMGNSLVVPMVTRMGRVLDQIVDAEP